MAPAPWTAALVAADVAAYRTFVVLKANHVVAAGHWYNMHHHTGARFRNGRDEKQFCGCYCLSLIRLIFINAIEYRRNGVELDRHALL